MITLPPSKVIFYNTIGLLFSIVISLSASDLAMDEHRGAAQIINHAKWITLKSIALCNDAGSKGWEFSDNSGTLFYVFPVTSTKAQEIPVEVYLNESHTLEANKAAVVLSRGSITETRLITLLKNHRDSLPATDLDKLLKTTRLNYLITQLQERSQHLEWNPPFVFAKGHHFTGELYPTQATQK